MSTRANMSKPDKQTESGVKPPRRPRRCPRRPPSPPRRRYPPRRDRRSWSRPGTDTYPERIGGIAETGQYERLISQMLFSGPDQHYMLAVTSAASGEGVTTTAVELGIALAQSTTKTVAIVDANLHRPALHTAFSAALQPGLRELIGEISSHNWEPGFAQSADWVKGFLRTNLPNLWVLPERLSRGQPVAADDLRGRRVRDAFDLGALRLRRARLPAHPVIRRGWPAMPPRRRCRDRRPRRTHSSRGRAPSPPHARGCASSPA